MNSYTEKWTRSVFEDKPAFEPYDCYQHLKTPYYTIVPQKKHRETEYQRKGYENKPYNFAYNNYKKHRREKKEEEVKENRTRKIVGYSKYNKEEEINNNVILRNEFEKKTSVFNGNNSGDAVCDNKSINSLETQNTMEEDGFPTGLREESASPKNVGNKTFLENSDENLRQNKNTYNKKFKTEDLKEFKEKNVKLSSVNTHNFDFSKFSNNNSNKEHFHNFSSTNLPQKSFSDYQFSEENLSNSLRKHHSENENKFSPSGFTSPYDFPRGTAPFSGNYLFPMFEGFPFMSPQFGFGSFLPNCYYGMPYPPSNNFGQSFNNSSGPKASSSASAKGSFLKHLASIKEECRKLNSQNSIKLDRIVEERNEASCAIFSLAEHSVCFNKKIEENCDKKEEKNEKQKIENQQNEKNENVNQEEKIIEKIKEKNMKQSKILNIKIKISDTITKTLSLSDSSNAFEETKKFCGENGLNDSLFFSIYKRISAALKTLADLPSKKEELKHFFGNTSDILSKAKRSHSSEPKGLTII